MNDLFALGAAALLAVSVFAQPWTPAPCPIPTKWSAEVNPERVLPEYPRPQMMREEWMNLNGLWQFAPAASDDEAPPFKRSLSRSILVPFPIESSLSGVGEHHERAWYRRTFTVPESWRGRRVILHFGAVDWEADVYMNGVYLASHRGGYDAFEVDISPALLADEPGEQQELVVGVFDPTDAGTQPRGKQVRKPEGIWYTPTSGIWQTVWLEPIPAHAIRGLVITPDIASGRAMVTVNVDHAPAGHAVSIRVPGAEPVSGPASTPIAVVAPGGRLWSPEDPYLYEMTVSTSDIGAPLDAPATDRVKSYFGLREVAVKKDDAGVTRTHLNGKPCFMVGPLDQGFWPDGLYTAPTDEALKYDVEMTRKLGFNMCRKHVKVEPARWYYWCDKLGLLVWQDMPSGDRYIGPSDADITRTPESAAQYEAELKAMIGTHFNSPSIVMWVVFNEGWGQFDTCRVVELTRKLDPTRLVDGVSGWADRGCGDVHDIHVYPGPGSPKPEALRAAVLGEFGGLGLGVDGHTWAPKHWGYQGTAGRDDLTEKYVRLLRRTFRLRDKPGLSAAVYTQTTDVETECNGLMTYDRAVLKVDAGKVGAANRGEFPQVTTFVPTAEGISPGQGPKWRYTLEKPAPGWEAPTFDDSQWRQGAAGFGAQGTPGAVIGTEWNRTEIWLRRTFDVPAGVNPGSLKGGARLVVHHDEDVVVYVNGVKALEEKGYTTDYVMYPMSATVVGGLRPSGNVLAVHCRQTGGGQFVDVGIAVEEANN